MLELAHLGIVLQLHMNPTGKNFGKRVTRDYELDIITHAENNAYITVNNKTLIVKPHMAFFRKPGMIVDGYGPYACYHFRFHCTDDFLDELLIPASIHLKDYTLALHICKEIEREFISKKTYCNHTISTNLAYLLLQLHNQNISNSLSQTDDIQSAIESAAKYIDEHCHEALDLDQMAKSSGYSKYFFIKQFQKFMNSTPYQYLLKCRIYKSCQLLLFTNESLNQIMFECGFENETTFYRVFKSQIHKTPTEYRNIFKKEYNL